MLIGLRESAPSLLLILGCGAAAALWLWRRSRAPAVAGDTQAAPRQRGDRAAWREFEARVTDAFRRQGYQILDGARGGAESGGELTLRRERETFLVQCKHWKEAKVGVDAVHALQRAMLARGASGGFVLTSGRFAREAVTFAAGCNVRLIDGATLQALLEQGKTERGPR
jgi:restriction system protein